MITQLNTPVNSFQRRKVFVEEIKPINYSKSVKLILKANKFINEYNITFRSFVALLIIVDSYNRYGIKTSYHGVYTPLFPNRSGGTYVSFRVRVYRLIELGLIAEEVINNRKKFYPTKAGLKAMKGFL